MKEKIGRSRKNHKIKVDMAAVSRLQAYQKEMRNKGINCSLIVEKDAPCSICCPHVKECKHFSIERDYINKQQNTSWTIKRRRNKKAKKQLKDEMLCCYCEDDLFDDEEETSDEFEDLVIEATG